MIIQSYDNGAKVKNIAIQLNKSATSISTFYSRFKLDCTLPSKEKQSKRSIQGRMGNALKKQTLENPKLSCVKLAAKLQETLPNSNWYPSRWTVWRYLKGGGFVKRNPTLKAPLSDTNKAKRLEFALKWMEGEECILENIVWTDESRVSTGRTRERHRFKSRCIREETP